MSDLSRRLFKQGLERAVKRGATLISSKEIDLESVVHSLFDHVRPTTQTATVHKPAPDNGRSLTETLFNMVRSADSVHDLTARVKSHRGEFADIARSSRSELVGLLTKIMEPEQRDDRGGTISRLPSSAVGGRNDDADDLPPSEDV